MSVGEFKERLHNDFELNIKGPLLTNALADARREFVENNWTFGLLTSYLDALKSKNEGTTASVVSRDGVFERAFLCPGVCARAFEHTPKIVGLDGCHVKARYGGVLLVMTALEGGGQIFPVAVGIAEIESGETWGWFLQQVRSALNVGDGEGLVVLSDREKGIQKALSEFLPQATQGFVSGTS